MKTLVQFITEAFNNSNNGDEFYTKLSDIEKELSNYNFKGKTVYCNCDDPSWSNFWKYFYDNFDKLGLKKLISTYFADSSKTNYSDDPVKTTYDGKDIFKEKIKSGRFQDNLDILKEVDIVVTNPPYSDGMPTQLLESLINAKVDFIFVGPLHLIIAKKAFEYFKTNKLNCGYTSINAFTTPSGKSKNAPSAWFTSFDVQHKPIKGVDRTDYEKYDDYDAIEVNPSSQIPANYDGKMGVPYRFMTKIDKNQFDIIEVVRPKLNGKKVMARVIIQYL